MSDLNNDNALTFAQLSATGKAKLLDMAFMPFVFGISSIPVCALALAIWAYELHKSIYGILIWGGAYVIAAIVMRLLNSQYKQEKLKAEHEKLTLKWTPIICFVALSHALGLTIPLFLILGQFSFEFKLLYYVIVAAILATFATHLTPLLKAFRYLFYPCWGVFVLLAPWIFPEQWHFMLLLMLAFAGSIHKHSIIGHQFFLKQILLEENEARIAKEYQNAKNQAEAALFAKNQFLTTASHDLRQPVHAMGFLIEAILRRNKDSTIQPALNDLKQSVRSVTQMFNSLLDLSKIESGNFALNTSNICLNMLIQEIATTFKEEALAKNIELRIRLPQGDAVIHTDRTLLHQSIMNLMHNALRYTEHGGILIAARKRGNDWQVEVWDTGIGVANDDQDRIYSPFFRNEHAWQIDSAGHGLGLSVVARCCQIMGCQYGFNSRLNRGSHFWLRLTAQADTFQSNIIIDETKLAESWQYPLSGTCLIVDDDPQVITAWEALLSSWGVTLSCVNSGERALAVLEQGFVPQVIFCDQRLRAGESGFDVLQALLERNPSAHGAMISGEFNSPELKKAESEGYLLLRKPLEPEQLFAILSRWLNKS